MLYSPKYVQNSFGLLAAGKLLLDQHCKTPHCVQVLLSVLEKLPEHVRASYACAPQRLVFGADIMASCMSDWLKSELVFEKRPSEEHSKAHNASIAAEKTAVLLRAVCFETPVDTSAECSDPGTFCCTLLSETQAYEYILYESQREGSIQKSAC